MGLHRHQCICKEHLLVTASIAERIFVGEVNVLKYIKIVLIKYTKQIFYLLKFFYIKNYIFNYIFY